MKSIECMVRCTSNKRDEVKGTRSITLNFDIKNSEGELIGKGNNLNINNLTDEDYRELCDLFGVEKISDRTPFMAELMVATEHSKLAKWKERWGEIDKGLDKKQTKIPLEMTEEEQQEEAEKDRQMEQRKLGETDESGNPILVRKEDFPKEINGGLKGDIVVQKKDGKLFAHAKFSKKVEDPDYTRELLKEMTGYSWKKATGSGVRPL